MMADVATQIAIRARLIASPAVLALVPAGSILDRHARPAPMPSIIIGEAVSTQPGGHVGGVLTKVSASLHVWQAEPSFEQCKAICGAIHAALFQHRLAMPDPALSCVECEVASVRYLRDPVEGVSHAAILVEVLVHGVTL